MDRKKLIAALKCIDKQCDELQQLVEDIYEHIDQFKASLNNARELSQEIWSDLGFILNDLENEEDQDD